MCICEMQSRAYRVISCFLHLLTLMYADFQHSEEQTVHSTMRVDLRQNTF